MGTLSILWPTRGPRHSRENVDHSHFLVLSTSSKARSSCVALSLLLARSHSGALASYAAHSLYATLSSLTDHLRISALSRDMVRISHFGTRV
jgi:hypothetical protein